MTVSQPGLAGIPIVVNGQSHEVEADERMPLLWVLRDRLLLTGTKFGCGIGVCGACTVHIDGAAVRSCVTPLAAVANRPVTTIEGLSPDGKHPLQRAWAEHQVPQCGYCQVGQLMTAAALLDRTPRATDADILQVMDTVYCRCGTYARILLAVRSVRHAE